MRVNSIEELIYKRGQAGVTSAAVGIVNERKICPGHDRVR